MLFELTDFYMEADNHKIQRDNLSPLNLVDNAAQFAIYDPRLNQDKMISKYQ